MHAGAWLDRLARSDGEPRDRLLAALAELAPDAATVFTPLEDEAELLDAGILDAPMAELEDRWRASIAPVFADLDLPMPPPARDPERGRLDHGTDFALAVGRVHVGPPRRPGSDLVSEAGIQVGVARTRAGAIAGEWRAPAATAIDEAAVRAALTEVMDPELPMLSVVDLGIIHRVDVAPNDGPITVEILPTFVGCPALELIKASIAERLGAFGRPVEVTATFEVPWTLRADQPGRSCRAARRRHRAARRRLRPATARRSSTSNRASRARTAARDGRPSRTCSGRRSAGRSATAPTVASRSNRSSRSDGAGARRRRAGRCPRSSASSVPGRWGPGSARSRSRPAARSSSTTSTRRPSTQRASGSATGWHGGPRNAACDAAEADDWVEARLDRDPPRPDRGRPGRRGRPRHRVGARGSRAEADGLPDARRRRRSRA